MQYSSRSENYSSSLRDSPSKWGSGNKESKGYAYKQASYQYSSSGTNNNNISYNNKSTDKNIDQLDALLEDLKNEREITRDRDHSLNYRTIDRSSNEDPLGGSVTKTTRVIKTSKHGGGGGGGAGLEDVEILPSSDYSTIRSNGSLVRSGYQTLDKSYGSKNLSPGGGGFYETKKTKIYESNRSLNKNTELVPVVGSMSTATSADIQEDLKNITINEDILPVPGTKVTTTVRTYTYEIPAGSGHIPASTSNTLNRKNVLYNTVQTNETNNIVHPHPVHAIPQTVVYNTESYSTLNRGSEKPIVSNQSYEVREHYESNTLKNNTLPLQPRNPIPNDTTIVYNINNTTTTTTERPGYPQSPNLGPNPVPYTNGPHSPHSPPHTGGPTTHRYFYKESTNTINNVHGPAGPPNEPLIGPKGVPPNTTRPIGGYPPNGNPPTGNVTYHYSSTTTNTNTNRRGPDYGTPSPHSLPPAPFPVDGVEFPPAGNGNPPQRVEELMQSFNNSDVVDRRDLNTPRKREIETAVASPNQTQIVPSVNRAGRDVYYPPGHETVLTKRDEMYASGSQGGGRWAKGSGMYEYESGYKSKSKTKTGGAMVPVCLPLCCAMPCSIM